MAPSRTPLGSRAPAARQVQVPSGRALVSSISSRRGTSLRYRLGRSPVPTGGAAITLPAMADVPVLMVHGFASSFERNWREPGWVDVLVHGAAPTPAEPEAYADLHRCVSDVLPTDTQVDAVGFSLGGQLLLRV